MKKGRYVRGGGEPPKTEATKTLSYLSPTPQPAVSNTDGKGFFAKHFPILLILLLTAGIYYVNFDNEPTNWDDDKKRSAYIFVLKLFFGERGGA